MRAFVGHSPDGPVIHLATADQTRPGIELLAATPGLDRVKPRALAKLVSKGKSRELGAGERLFVAGEDFRDEVYVLTEGRVEVTRGDGRVERPPPGYLLGLSSYLADAPYASTVTALAPSRIWVIGARRLRRLEGRHPTLFDAFNRLITSGLESRSVLCGTITGPLAAPVRLAMSAPPVACAPHTTVAEALTVMREAGVGSLVVLDGDGGVLGQLTHRTLAWGMARNGGDADTIPVTKAMGDAVTADAGTPLWKARDRLAREGRKHLVVSEAGIAAGVLSESDLLRVLAEHEGGMTERARRASTYEALAQCYRDMTEVAARALESNRRARLAVRVLSEAHLAVQGRCIELTLEEMAAEGRGEAPFDFALIIMGSGGRREMMLDPDQDNGIILAGEARHDAERSWFQDLSERVNVNLDRVGYALCPGDIMARNSMYHKSLDAWRAQISRMCARPNEKAARWSSIVFDFDGQYGDPSLVRALREHVGESVSRHPKLLAMMVDDDAQGQASINWFNRLVTTGERDGKGTVDVKRNGLRIVANATRILALRERVEACNTSDRILALVRRGLLSPDFGTTIYAAYDELLDILLAHQIHQRRAGREPDKQVAPGDLRPPDRDALRVSMRAVKRLQDFLQDQVGGVQV